MRQDQHLVLARSVFLFRSHLADRVRVHLLIVDLSSPHLYRCVNHLPRPFILLSAAPTMAAQAR